MARLSGTSRQTQATSDGRSAVFDSGSPAGECGWRGSIHLDRGKPAGHPGADLPGCARDPGYAALVQIEIISWNPGFTKTPITSASQIAELSSAGEISINDTGIITDDPIVAIGGLGGAWLPQPPGTYEYFRARYVRIISARSR